VETLEQRNTVAISATKVPSKLLTMKILKYLPEWTNCHVTFRNVVAHGKWVRSVDAAVEMGKVR
jgi:hypothetical protein